jgi:hypothetical protein
MVDRHERNVLAFMLIIAMIISVAMFAIAQATS